MHVYNLRGLAMIRASQDTRFATHISVLHAPSCNAAIRGWRRRASAKLVRGSGRPLAVMGALHAKVVSSICRALLLPYEQVHAGQT